MAIDQYYFMFHEWTQLNVASNWPTDATGTSASTENHSVWGQLDGSVARSHSVSGFCEVRF